MGRLLGTLLCAAMLFSPGTLVAQDSGAPVVPEQVVEESAPPPAPLVLITTNVTGATIRIDERPPVTAPAPALPLSAGEHRVLVEADGYESAEQTVTLGPEGARLNVFLEPTAAHATQLAAESEIADTPDTAPVHKRWWFWAAIGGGVVVVAGIITAIAIAGGDDEGQSVIPVPPIPGGP